MGSLAAAAKFLDKNLVVIMQFFAMALLFFFVTLSYYCYWADSEIWGITLAKRFGDFSVENHSLYFKPLFYLILRCLYFIEGSNVSVFLNARLAFCLLGCANIFLTWRFAKLLFHRRRIAMLAVILLVGNTLYINQGFRVRSDIFSLFWHLVFMNYLLHFSRSPCRDSWVRPSLWMLVINGLMLAATPKAIYFYAAQCVYAFALGLTVPETHRKRYWYAILIAFFFPAFLAADFLLVSTIFSMLGKPNRIFSGYYSAWTFFINALSVWDPLNIDSERYFFLFQFFSRNPELPVLIATPVLFTPIALFAKNRVFTPARMLGLYGLALLLVSATYNDYLPFFLASLLPILCVLAAGFVDEFLLNIAKGLHLRERGNRNLHSFAFASLTLYTFVKGAMFFWLVINFDSNMNQRAVISTVEKYLAEFPGVEMYDVIGILPRRNTIYKFVGPGQGFENRVAAWEVSQRKPGIICYVAKSDLLQPELGQLLESSYTDLGHGFFGRAYNQDMRAEDKISIQGEDFYRVPAMEVRRGFESLFGEDALAKLKIHLIGHDQKRLAGRERILFLKSAEADPVAFSPEHMKSGAAQLQDAFLLIPDAAVRIAATIFYEVPVQYPGPMDFVFAFDYLY